MEKKRHREEDGCREVVEDWEKDVVTPKVLEVAPMKFA